jgi:hypothetical protein
MLNPPTESAIVIKVPEVESVVGTHRRALDPSEEWGMPAHVTLLYPFLPPSDIDADVFTRLETIVCRHQQFSVEFFRAAWFDDEVLWLSPEPDLSFRRLTSDLFAAFPETPPYGGSITYPTPHLTVADGAGIHLMKMVESIVTAKLPIKAEFDSVSVMVGSRERGSWKEIAGIPLGVSVRTARGERTNHSG